jgi:undecaprenyl-diphosphatase
MNAANAIIYGVVQGLTEFLPISSSGHLAFLQNFFGEVDVSFDIMLHMATLLAVIVYFYKDLTIIAKKIITLDLKSENIKFVLYIIIASVPAALLGIFLKDYIDSYFSNILLIAQGFVISGIFLFIASFAKNRKTKLGFKNTFVIGISQALAILPGISRSGTTTSTAFFFGINKEKALKFSFLLSIPIILGATLIKVSEFTFNSSLIIPSLFAFVTGVVSIHLFIKVIQIKNLKYFAYYCWFIALLILVLKMTRVL